MDSTKSPFTNQLKVLQYCVKKRIKMCLDAVDYFEEAGHAYLVTKHAGNSLRTYFSRKDKEIPMTVAMKLLQSIALGLYELHNVGIVLGRLSLDSIKVSPKNDSTLSLYFSGFERAYLTDKKAANPGEQAYEGKASDIYAFGQLAYQLLSCHNEKNA